MIIANIFTNFLMLLFFFLRIKTLPPQIPLFYSHFPAENQLTDLWLIFLIPVIMNAFFFLNIYITKKLFLDNYLINKISQYLNYFILLGFAFAFIKIILTIS